MSKTACFASTLRVPNPRGGRFRDRDVRLVARRSRSGGCGDIRGRVTVDQQEIGTQAGDYAAPVMIDPRTDGVRRYGVPPRFDQVSVSLGSPIPRESGRQWLSAASWVARPRLRLQRWCGIGVDARVVCVDPRVVSIEPRGSWG